MIFLTQAVLEFTKTAVFCHSFIDFIDLGLGNFYKSL